MNEGKIDILVVDDVDAIRKQLVAVFIQAGYKVEQASNGMEAVALLKQRQFSLVITDIFMPDKDGLELIQEIRQLFPEVKVIAISGGGTLSDLQGTAKDYLKIARAFGADGVLVKPFTMDEALAIVAAVLRAT